MEKTRLFVYVTDYRASEVREFELDLDSSVTFSLTRQFTDLNNPTAIYSVWSKSISLPFTKNNNMIFGMIFNPDRIVYVNDYNNSERGTIATFDFNPSLKVPFRLLSNNCVIMTGYIKFLSVERKTETTGKYNIVLNGEIGKVFNNLKKITFDETLYEKIVDGSNNDDYYKYFIEGGNYVFENIDRELIKSSWNAANARSLVLKKRTDSGYTVTDIIGFAPNNSFSDNFDYTSMIDASTEKSIEIAEYLTNLWNKPSASADKFASPVDAKTLVGKGIPPRAFGEYRSYNQLPFIYWNQLFQIFCEQVHKATAEKIRYMAGEHIDWYGGYTVELDDSWFNSSNPYWAKLVYMLNPLTTTYITPFSNKYKKLSTETLISDEFGTTIVGNAKYDVYRFATVFPEHQTRRQLYPETESSIRETTPMFTVGDKLTTMIEYDYFKTDGYKTVDIHIPDVFVDVNFEMNETPQYYIHGLVGRLRIHDNNALLVNFELWKSDANYLDWQNLPIKTYKFAVVSTNTTVDTNALEARGYTITASDSYELLDGSGGANTCRCLFNATTDIYDTIEQPLYTNGIKLVASTAWLNTNVQTFITEYYNDNAGITFREVVYKDTEYVGYGTSGSSMSLYDVNLDVYSNQGANTLYPFTLNSLWNNEYNLFDEILKYCKQFRIFIVCDNIEKKLKFIPYYKYFESGYDNGNGILDWSDKVDYSRDWKLEPIIADSKYLLFNYEDSETSIATAYKTKYKYNFGEKRIETPYNFDDKTNKILDGVRLPMVSTDTLLAMNDISGQYVAPPIDEFTVLPVIRYSVYNESFVTTADKDGKTVDTFGQFYFDNGLKNFDDSHNGMYLTNPAYITDDTIKEVSENKRLYNRFYTMDSSQRQLTYRNLDVIDDNGNMILYGVPKEKYTYGGDSYEGASGMYDSFWKKYMEDLYSLQNKKVTCYIRLTPEDWEEFEFNRFVLINDTLYVVNKIFDFSFNPSQPTKVELISVNDVENYTYTGMRRWYVVPTDTPLSHLNEGVTSVPYEFRLEGNTVPATLDNIVMENMPNTWSYTYNYQYIDSSNAIISLNVETNGYTEPNVVYNITVHFISGDVNQTAKIHIIGQMIGG